MIHLHEISLLVSAGITLTIYSQNFDDWRRDKKHFLDYPRDREVTKPASLETILSFLSLSLPNPVIFPSFHSSMGITPWFPNNIISREYHTSLPNHILELIGFTVFLGSKDRKKGRFAHTGITILFIASVVSPTAIS